MEDQAPELAVPDSEIPDSGVIEVFQQSRRRTLWYYRGLTYFFLLYAGFAVLTYVRDDYLKAFILSPYGFFLFPLVVFMPFIALYLFQQIIKRIYRCPNCQNAPDQAMKRLWISKAPDPLVCSHCNVALKAPG